MARTFIFSLLVTYFNISTCDYAYFIYQLHPNDNELLDKGTNCRFFHNYGKHENLIALNLSLGSYKGLQFPELVYVKRYSLDMRLVL